jgi:hypothetical protein
MRQTDPRVNDRANLEGERMMVGRKRKKARKRNTADAARKENIIVICCPEGMLQGRERER